MGSKNAPGIICAFLVLSLQAAARAHDNWITADNYFPRPGRQVTLSIASGHSFPESGDLISESLLEGILVTRPDGVKELLEVFPDGAKNVLRASLNISSTGTYTAYYELRRPQVSEPIASGSLVLISGGICSGDRKETGGVRIVSLDDISGARPGSNLRFAILQDGESTGGVLSVTPENARSYRMRARPNRPARIMAESGMHLIVTSEGGRRHSFTFFVPGGENDED